MSFAQQVKQEIAARVWETPCCNTAACYGIACFARTFDKKGLELHTETVAIAQWAKAQLKQCGVHGKIFVRGERHKTYAFAVADPYEVEKLLALFGHSGDETALRLHRDNFLCDDCLAAFTAAAFLCAGTVVAPEKGYNLEFISPRYGLMEDFMQLLAQRGFAPRHTTRKGANVLYFHASEQIEDMLTFMGAGRSTLEIMHLKVLKDLRNNANRITNCETANIDKVVAASHQTILAIQTLAQLGILDTLPEPLQQAARLRRDHPDLSLAELVPLSPKPTSRSRLSQRFKQLREKAAEHQQQTGAADG